jgi:hypothetical protein
MRTLRILSAFLALAALTACASAIRLPGQRDPMVEVVRILADALKDQKVPVALPSPPPAATPTPTPTPEGGR